MLVLEELWVNVAVATIRVTYLREVNVEIELLDVRGSIEGETR